jgi:hypothetical protein
MEPPQWLADLVSQERNTIICAMTCCTFVATDEINGAYAPNVPLASCTIKGVNTNRERRPTRWLRRRGLIK